MLNFCRIFTCRIPNVLRINASRTAVVATNHNIVIEMKRLNAAGQFSTALALFNELQRHEVPRDQAIVQALKACTRLRRLECGVNIHKKLSNCSAKNNYVEAALIHFYSQFNRSPFVHLSSSRF